MTQREAKRWYVYYLRKVDDLSDATMEEIDNGDDEVVDPSKELDQLGELLKDCRDVIHVRRSALEAIGLEPGATFADAALIRALSGLDFDDEIETLPKWVLDRADEWRHLVD